jgi:hypothetical protein
MQINIDLEKSIIEVCGVKYALPLFYNFAKVGNILRIERNEEGVLTVTTLGEDKEGKVKREDIDEILCRT